MQIGDIVEVIWDGCYGQWENTLAVVIRVDQYVRIVPFVANSITVRQPQAFYSFHPESLKVLGHIDVAQEGEKQNANRR